MYSSVKNGQQSFTCVKRMKRVIASRKVKANHQYKWNNSNDATIKLMVVRCDGTQGVARREDPVKSFQILRSLPRKDRKTLTCSGSSPKPKWKIESVYHKLKTATLVIRYFLIMTHMSNRWEKSIVYMQKNVQVGEKIIHTH